MPSGSGQDMVADGWIRFCGDGGEKLVAVEDGRWALEVASGQSLVLRQDAAFGDRDARLSASSAPLGPFTEDTELMLEAKWLTALPLIVRDAETGRHLTGLTVVESWANGLYPTAADQIVVDGATSPLKIERWSRTVKSYLVRCEGYGWHHVEVDPFGAPCEISMDRGEANLNVTVSGAKARDDVWVGIAPVGETNQEEWTELSGCGDVNIEHLRPGLYEIMVSSDDGSIEPSVIRQLHPKLNELALGLSASPEVSGSATTLVVR